MNIKRIVAPVVNYYRDLRWNNLHTRKYNHILIALYWPLYGVIFAALESWLPKIFNITYAPVYCPLDDLIPFCEWFVIPYYFWFVFLAGFGVFWLFYEVEIFREWMWATILMYSATVVIYLIWPNMQELRPMTFERDNLFIDIVKGLYGYDTNTNVCPSIHVLGSLAVMFAGLRSKIFGSVGWKIFFIVSTVLICASTVFLKQHSIIDVFVALALGAVCWVLQYVVLKRWMAAPETSPEETAQA